MQPPGDNMAEGGRGRDAAATPLPDTVIEIRNFSFRFGGTQILNDVSFTVQRGEHLSIVGPNGAGKTTLLKCVDRILTGGVGEIRICGRPLESYRQRELARLISYVPQADGRVFPYTVEQFVLMGRYPYLSPFSPVSKEDHRAVGEALEMTGTTQFTDRMLDTLSGGDKVKAPVGDYARVQSIRQGEQTTLGGVVYFQEGTAELTEEHKRTLQQTAQVIGGKPQKIEIHGHTSTRPLPADSLYDDHWDLAYDRCRKVMQFLIKLGIDPKRIRIAQAADNEPVHSGVDPRLQAQNPRVEVFMLNELARERAGTPEERQQKFSAEGAP